MKKKKVGSSREEWDLLVANREHFSPPEIPSMLFEVFVIMSIMSVLREIEERSHTVSHWIIKIPLLFKMVG